MVFLGPGALCSRPSVFSLDSAPPTRRFGCNRVWHHVASCGDVRMLAPELDSALSAAGVGQPHGSFHGNSWIQLRNHWSFANTNKLDSEKVGLGCCARFESHKGRELRRSRMATVNRPNYLLSWFDRNNHGHKEPRRNIESPFGAIVSRPILGLIERSLN